MLLMAIQLRKMLHLSLTSSNICDSLPPNDLHLQKGGIMGDQVYVLDCYTANSHTAKKKGLSNRGGIKRKNFQKYPFPLGPDFLV